MYHVQSGGRVLSIRRAGFPPPWRRIWVTIADRRGGGGREQAVSARSVDGSVAEGLVQVTFLLDQLGGDHRKCLGCQCFREVAEEALEAVDMLAEHVDVLQVPVPLHAPEVADGLRRLLASSEGTHG
jgi:hypothetical protein